MKIVIVALTLALAAVPRSARAQVPDQVDTPIVPSTYVLGAGDVIEIRFFNNPELNDQVQIRPDGRISARGVGELSLTGLTVPEAVDRLAAGYASLLRAPSITIQVRSFANNRVFVAGEVARPGVQPLVGEQTALTAIVEAGGFKSTAKRSEVIVIRRGQKDLPQVLRLGMDARGAEPSTAASFLLQPQDVVVVAESGIAKTNRAVDQYVRQMIPGLFTFGFSYLFNNAVLGVK
jgi:protein involved in polysaccharide export with SLBB domain